MWRVARDSGKLDLNSSYAYLLWCRDFAETSVVAREAGDVVGFVIGYRRPQAVDVLVVWQVAVDASHRGGGLAGALLDELLDRVTGDRVRYLETTVTPDNAPSLALFASLATRWSAEMGDSELFASDGFPDEHEPERLYRIGPLKRATGRVTS
jgi:L-2,4-diaminobutyric acid acetyltransferase